MKTVVKIALLFTFAALLTSFATAETPGIHPAYLHALSDLRYARALLDRGAPDGRGNPDEFRAIRAIDAAINEIKQAAYDDGKPLGDHPPVDNNWNAPDRFRRALDLLNSAYHNVDQREDNRWNRGHKERALGRIDEARRAIHHAIEAGGHDHQHDRGHEHDRY